MDHGHVLAQKDYVHCNQEINVDTPLSGTLWHHNNNNIIGKITSLGKANYLMQHL